jgi:anti-anti-sigma factor
VSPPRTEFLEPYHLIRFAGSLDVSRYPEFRQAFEAVPQSIPVLVDLTEVDIVDSTFLSEMLLLKRRHHGKLVTLIPPRSQVARLFEIANLGERLQVHSDLSAAVNALGVRRSSEAAGEEVAAD